MNKPYVDLHVHSYYSDGSMSPKEIVNSAVENSVGILAIADHDVLTGSIELKQLCLDNDIKYVPAVEIDTAELNRNYHILAYGFDIDNSGFRDFIKHTRFCLDEMSIKLIELMQNEYENISLDEFFKYVYDRTLGGWSALHYLMDKGLSTSLKGGIRYYTDYNLLYSLAGFSTVSATTHRIKDNGGYSILAHPGEVIDTSDVKCFTDELRRLIAFGLDGIECYYPTHTEAITQACLDICYENNLMITSGSDCHGVFGSSTVGGMKILPNILNLRDL